MPDARCTRSRLCSKKAQALATTGTPLFTRHSLRSGFNGVFRALPGDRALLPPSSADGSANLTPASGRQDHTTSPSATMAFVSCRIASTASRLTSVTIAKRPSVGTGPSRNTPASTSPSSQFRKFRNRSRCRSSYISAMQSHEVGRVGKSEACPPQSGTATNICPLRRWARRKGAFARPADSTHIITAGPAIISPSPTRGEIRLPCPASSSMTFPIRRPVRQIRPSTRCAGSARTS
jgi:hypothetical protein